MDEIFSLPAVKLTSFFVAFGIATFCLAYAHLCYSHKHVGSKPTSIPVAPFASSITTVWALCFGFMTWEINSAETGAIASAIAERSALSRLSSVADRSALDLPVVVDGLRAYKAAVERIEWGETANREPRVEVEMALEHIRFGIVSAVKDGVDTVLISRAAQDVYELQIARNQRLAIGRGSNSSYKWYLVFLLTFLSQIAIVTVHADRPNAGRKALAVFTIAATVSLWIVALYASAPTLSDGSSPAGDLVENGARRLAPDEGA